MICCIDFFHVICCCANNFLLINQRGEASEPAERSGRMPKRSGSITCSDRRRKRARWIIDCAEILERPGTLPVLSYLI
nr:MAG TPA: hypothetical protein [Microviridae sp.]